MADTIFYIAKKRELRVAAPERCCLTLRQGPFHYARTWLGTNGLVFCSLKHGSFSWLSPDSPGAKECSFLGFTCYVIQPFANFQRQIFDQI